MAANDEIIVNITALITDSKIWFTIHLLSLVCCGLGLSLLPMFLYQEVKGELNVVCAYSGVMHNLPIQDCATDCFRASFCVQDFLTILFINGWQVSV